MAMNSNIIVAFIFLLSPLYCFARQEPPDTFMGVSVEEKTRLGSTPPSCHNKCNQCHPCMAVQVPTLPSHNQVDPSLARKIQPTYYSDSSGSGYTNYKPLGWKCRCEDHFYNP